MQYFASFQPFEIFEEFNDVPVVYIKSFLISDRVNLNKWQATHAANLSSLDSFLGIRSLYLMYYECDFYNSASTWYKPEYFQYGDYGKDM